jgi:LiaI-LiaF-like transmembrane region
MKCAVHADVDATGFCRNCGKALCPACTREVRGALYCEPCLAGLVSTPPAEQPGTRADVHPGAALALGFIPGLGDVYNGEYVKALIHVLVFGGLIAAQTSAVSGGYHAFLGIALGCFYLYMPIEAYRTARARQAGAPESAASADGGERRPVGAMILVALGILLLLGNFGLLEWDWFAKAWPAGLIVLGVWMLSCRLKERS